MSPALVVEIRQRVATGETSKAAALRYGLSVSFVQKITSGVAWRCVGGPVRKTGARGEHVAKLTPEAVIRIREALATGASLRSLAAKHGVSKTTITKVGRGMVWKHVGGPLTVTSPNRWLTEDHVREIREALAAGDAAKVIAHRYGLWPAAVRRIGRGLVWKEAGGPLIRTKTVQPAEVSKIRARLAAGVPVRLIAQECGFSDRTVYAIRRCEGRYRQPEALAA